MHQTTEVDLSMIKVYNQNLGPLLNVYIWEMFIIPMGNVSYVDNPLEILLY